MREPSSGGFGHRGLELLLTGQRWGVCTADITQLVGVIRSQLTGGLDTAQLSLRSLGSVTRAFSGTISPILTAVSGSRASITERV